MLNDDVQKQNAGDASTNLQARTITINQGLTYRDAKEIALDVYKENFLKLSADASRLAIQRAEEFTDKFLEKLKNDSASSVESMKEPGMQIALYSAQKEYARTGDVDLQNLLVDILVERSKSVARDIKQIVLDESLEIAPRLTPEQFDVLTLSWLLTRTKNNGIISKESLDNYIRTYLLPFVDSLNESTSCYEHIQYLGCGDLVQLGDWGKIEKRLRDSYPGIFCKGVSDDDIKSELGDMDTKGMVIKSLHNDALFQISAMDLEVIKSEATRRGLSDDLVPKLNSIFEKSRMSEAEVRDYILKVDPKVDRLLSIWEKTPLNRLTLTTVGYAIAQANFRRKTGSKVDLSIWVK
jgi:hypothetical protein